MTTSLTVKRPITVKAVVTEELLAHTVAELQLGIRKAEAELQQIELHGRKALAETEKRNPREAAGLRQQIAAEKNKREETKAKLTERIKEVNQLKLGTEIVQGTIEGITEIRVGDSWEELFAAEVVVKDGKIVEIRRA